MHVYTNVIPFLFFARCDDDTGEFFFSNGATLHFYFAHVEPNKFVSDALLPHGNVEFSFYDAVVANPGNAPHLRVDSMLDAAFELQAVGVRALRLQ